VKASVILNLYAFVIVGNRTDGGQPLGSEKKAVQTPQKPGWLARLLFFVELVR
jgi:hypothetical protein